mmetsp:Transcript_27497/g.27718  ORF Transcript_27497/g.27718 Transcript_27497/m.27718 type:complete len:115 (+) Transcript_27497:100-444(+)
MSTGSSIPVKRGKLKLKGENDSKKVSKKRRMVEEEEESTSVHSIHESTPPLESKDDHLTEAQKRHIRKKLELEKKDIKKLVSTTYRERIEDYNYKLSKMSEHNDIPRVSAAGNG